MLLFAWTSLLILFSLFSWIAEFLKQISFAAKKHLSSFLRSTFRWNCNFTHFLGKTKLISQFCPLKSVRFLLILSKFLLNIFIFLFDCQGSLCHTFMCGWSVWMDSNHRPHAYQACALTTWATDRFSFGSPFVHRVAFRLVEMMGFEPMTPCLQGRCSPSWATPPSCKSGVDRLLLRGLRPSVLSVPFTDSQN